MISSYLYAKDILNTLLDNKKPDLEALIRKPYVCTTSYGNIPLDGKFRESDVNEAVVLDEYGGCYRLCQHFRYHQ